MIGYLPDRINRYVETFGGMFWFYLNQDIDEVKNYESIIYNDKNSNNANFWNCLSKCYGDVLEEAMKIDFQKKSIFNRGKLTDKKYELFFNEFQYELFSKPYKFDIEHPDPERAVKLAYVINNVFSGLNPESSSFMNLKHNYHSRQRGFLNKLLNSSYKEHCENITLVESLDFEDVITKYDDVNTFFYVDPPYYGTEDYYAMDENFTRKDHRRLIDLLKGCKGKWMLSYYNFTSLAEMLPPNIYHWESKAYTKSSGNLKGRESNSEEELIIMNY